MQHVKKLFSLAFLTFMGLALLQCAKRGTPTGGPKDITPPQLVRAEPDNFTVNFEADKIRLYFDELVKLQDVQNQLVVSPPLKYPPELKPQGSPGKYVEIIFKDTLKENTTYTLNFGQSITDNNEGNPNSFFTYVFSTGSYLDSLTLSGAVKDAFNRTADEFITVMLYERDTAFNDSTIYKTPPLYIANTSDSLPIFNLRNLKAGEYALVGLKDVNKNNLFDQRQDKIAFLKDTITLPTDSVYLLNLFRERPDYSASVPSYVAKNHILFGFQGNYEDINIETLTELPDSVRTLILKEREKDTLNYWITPTDLDSIVFTVTNTTLDQIDTFTVKTRKLPLDSLQLVPSKSGRFNFEDTFSLLANTPIAEVDTTRIGFFLDSVPAPYEYTLDSLGNKIDFEFSVEPNLRYSMYLLPGAITDFFGIENDTLDYNLSIGSYADYGNLRLRLGGVVKYPVVIQLTDENGDMKREIPASESRLFEFNNLDPAKYIIRVIFDENGNGKWDTGNYLKKIQPEKVSYYPDVIDVRANWELEQNFIISD